MTSQIISRKVVITPVASSGFPSTFRDAVVVSVPGGATVEDVLEQILAGVTASLNEGMSSAYVLGVEFSVADFVRTDSGNTREAYPNSFRFKGRNSAWYRFLQPEVLEPADWVKRRLRDAKAAHAKNVQDVLNIFSEFEQA